MFHSLQIPAVVGRAMGALMFPAGRFVPVLVLVGCCVLQLNRLAIGSVLARSWRRGLPEERGNAEADQNTHAADRG